MLKHISVFLACCLFTLGAIAQPKAVVSGKVTNERGRAMDAVTVAVKGTTLGINTDRNGAYTLDVPADSNITIVFTYVGFETDEQPITVSAGQNRVLNIRLKQSSRQMKDFVKTESRGGNDAGSLRLDVSKATEIPTVGFGDGVTAIIKSYVGTNNELTNQYNVRGGNYDENLVYVNDFEIYRPFLTRSGQQEGMSFVNSDLVSGVNFSVGGFQAKYGDKMSSVLDVNYKNPTEFGGRVTASALGASVALQGASRNSKLTWLTGVRHKSNQYLLQAQPTKGVYTPSFTDAQADVKYQFSNKWEMELIGNYARNRFRFIPEKQNTSFGLINKAFQLNVQYLGSEIDQFDSRFGGISTTYKPNNKLRLKLLASGFQTNEKETYDINGEYFLGELETDLGKENFGQVKTYLGTGIIHNYARNYLQVNVGDVGHRGSYEAGKHFLQWGLGANVTTIGDKLNEWERRDSAGFTQPFDPNRLPLTKVYNSAADFNYMRYTAYLQDNFRFSDSLDLTGTVGVRMNYSTLNGEVLVSPRGNLAYKPKWKQDIIFKLAGGLYQQPPFYREMRDLNGAVNYNLKAQKSFHTLLGADYNFTSWGRPFKLTVEAYYKGLWDVVPYEYDNVRVRYFGRNNARGRIYGGEVRIYGDIVKDATSWISVGILKAEEDITDDKITYKDVNGADSGISYPGYIPRPSDQRFMLGMYFEDYLPRNKNFKMHLNAMYSSGLPFGPPDQKRYGDTLRLPQYIRADIGFSTLLLDGTRHTESKIWHNLKKAWFSIEVFNLLGIRNTLSYTWIQDQTSGLTFAVPNRLTSRLVNAKLVIDF